MVRLKGAGLKVETLNVLTCFNSKMVRLKDIVSSSFAAASTGFNSKMVRLKGVAFVRGKFDLQTFQFQNGTIKS